MDTILGDEQFSRIARFIESHYGIRIPPEKKVMIQSRLSRRVRELNCPSIDDYIRRLLENPEGGAEISRMTDLVSTHMTGFFREPSHFELLAGRLLPELALGRDYPRDAPLVAWSAACSTGEEAYSLAMVLEEFRGTPGRSARRLEYAVLGTDLSEGVLETARRGIFPAAALQAIPEPRRSRFVMRARSEQRQEGKIVPEIRRRVFFHPLNLMEEDYGISTGIQLIFCRNVLIYFRREDQEKVLKRLCRVLAPDGFLVLGHAESIVSMDLGLVQYAPTVYRKARQAHADA